MSFKKHIPNTITSMNLVSGILGVISTFNGRLDIAFLMMIAAAIFDFMDGLAARATNSYSEIGKELDSLCDMVSFGVLPSLMLYWLMKDTGGYSYICYIPLILAVFSALRLAKFNIDPRQHHSFLGLPTPAAAIICGSYASCVYSAPDSFFALLAANAFFIPALSLALGLLLVCEIPMFAFKFGKGSNSDTITNMKRIATLSISVIMAIVVAVTSLNWAAAVLFTFLTYIVVNLVSLALPKQ